MLKRELFANHELVYVYVHVHVNDYIYRYGNMDNEQSSAVQ